MEEAEEAEEAVVTIGVLRRRKVVVPASFGDGGNNTQCCFSYSLICHK